MSDRIIIIGGTTATGKSALGIAVAKEIGGEIVSADSMQIYRRMNIGTAKVTEDEMQRIPHYMIDVVEPDQPFSVAEYQDRATKIINEILSRGKTPIVVGGTGLYVNSILFPMEFKAYDPAIREQINEVLQTKGKEYLYGLLTEKDPDAARRLSPNDVKRVTRALELALNGFSHNRDDLQKAAKYNYSMYVLSGDRQKIYDRINARVDVMMQQGLREEVKALLQSGVSPRAQSFQAIAYKEFAEYFDGERDLDETLELIKKRSRNYAKRQLTWFRQYRDAQWLDYEKVDENYQRILEDARRSE